MRKILLHARHMHGLLAHKTQEPPVEFIPPPHFTNGEPANHQQIRYHVGFHLLFPWPVTMRTETV